MATPASSTIYIQNTSGKDAWIVLQHQNSTNGVQSGVWFAAAGATVGPLTVNYEIGWDATANDYWWVYLGIVGGDIYTNGGTLVPNWGELMMRHEDNGKTYTFKVSTTEFNVIAYNSETFTVSSTGIPFVKPITNVFVVMLENHSLDYMLGLSGIPGITPMTTANYNMYNGTKYPVKSPAPTSMPTDPGHELPDTLQQLTNTPPEDWNLTPSSKSLGPYKIPLGAYPALPPLPGFANGTGFAANYATTTDEGDGPPTPAQIGDIMSFFLPSQLPVLNQLANEFAVCSRWFSSIPGPTWPNRFFVHSASSDAMDCSPGSAQLLKWETVDGFTTPHGSIYDRLDAANLKYNIFNDCVSPLFLSIVPPIPNPNGGYSLFSDDPNAGKGILGLGFIPQVTSLKGVSLLDVNSVKSLNTDLKKPYPYTYTFIEPHYGDVANSSYVGGSSQHPLDDVYGGEALLKYVYESIRNSPIWDTSLLIVTYDEHGGFYDSVPPPKATPPNDGSASHGQPNTLNEYGFQFDQYGVRVPAVVISPFVNQGVVDSVTRDHTSVLATVEALFGLAPLTDRDKNANNVVSLMSLTTPRTNCPTVLNPPAPSTVAAKVLPTVEEQAVLDAKPIPESGNVKGALAILRKTEVELSAGTDVEKAVIHENFRQIKTRKDAKDYAQKVLQKVEAAKAVRKKK